MYWKFRQKLTKWKFSATLAFKTYATGRIITDTVAQSRLFQHTFLLPLGKVFSLFHDTTEDRVLESSQRQKVMLDAGTL